jgi:RNA polymerase sigma factor (sigma-70 family)
MATALGWIFAGGGFALALYQTWQARKSERRASRIEQLLLEQAQKDPNAVERATDQARVDLALEPPVRDEAELREVLGDAISRLPEREKLVVTLYYYEELTLAEIAQVLGVTETRVRQIHTRAVLRLRARLAEAGLDDPTRLGNDAEEVEDELN